MGLRQLRHPVQGVRHARDARAPSRRRSPTRPRCTGSPGSRRRSPCTSRGTWSTTTPPCARSPRTRASRSARSTPTPSRTTTTSSAALTHTDAGDPAEGDRPPPRVHRRHGRHRLAGPQDLAGRRDQLPGAGRHPGPAGPAGRLAGRRSTSASPRPATRARVQVLRAGVLPHRRARLGHGVRAGARPSASGPWSASTPATTRPGPTSSSSSPSCSGWGSWARSTSTAASTPTTTSSSARPTRSSCSASSSRCVRGGGFGPESDVAFMLDQCHNIEKKIPGQIRSVLNVQEMTARALLVDTAALAEAQEDGDVLAANEIFMDAFYTDVRRDLAALAGGAGPARRPDAGLPRQRLPGADRGGPRRRHPGRMELT